MRSFVLVETRWGSVALVGEGERLERLILPGLTKAELVRSVRSAGIAASYDRGLFRSLQRSIRRYFEGHKVAFEVALGLDHCPPFFAQVYRACRRVGYGQVTTYGQLARAVGRPGAARAVGAAMSRNPLPVVVPCHRVVASGGRLGGFSAAGGLKLKRRMLVLEGALPPG